LRQITETILETAENVEPELGGRSSSSQQTSATPTAQPATPKPAGPASATTSQPVAKPASATPAPVPAAPPAPRRRFGLPSMPPMSPAAASQVELAQQYSSVLVRAGRVKSGLAQYQRQQSGSVTELPDDVRAARDRLDTQLQAVASAMGARNNGLAKQNLHAAEDMLTVIEQFLAK